MKCKDFTVGESVIIYNRRSEHKFTDTVAKVGRKYVVTDRGYKFSESVRFEFSLVNEYEYGSDMLMFKDDTAFLNHQNKVQALADIRNMIGRYQLETYKKIYIDQILEIIKKGVQE